MIEQFLSPEVAPFFSLFALLSLFGGTDDSDGYGSGTARRSKTRSILFLLAAAGVLTYLYNRKLNKEPQGE